MAYVGIVPVCKPKVATPNGLASPAYTPRGMPWAIPGTTAGHVVEDSSWPPAGAPLRAALLEDPTRCPFGGTTTALSEEATNVIEASSTTTVPRTTHAHHTR